jgi:hypothetical protein
LDALEEAIIFGASSRGLLIRVMTKNLLTMGTLNLFLGGFVTVL